MTKAGTLGTGGTQAKRCSNRSEHKKKSGEICERRNRESNRAGHSDFAGAGCAADMAVQRVLGLLPERRIGIGAPDPGYFGTDGPLMKAKIVRRKSAALRLHSPVKIEPLLNTLARTVGRAAGAIANAAQVLSGENKAPIVPTKVRKKSRRRPSTRVAQRKTGRSRTAKVAGK